MDGNFSFMVSPNTMIEISYIGYQEQRIKTVFGKSMFITLKEDTELLDEVVVVGYGIQKKVNLTGAVSVVDAKTIQNRPITNATQALQGESKRYCQHFRIERCSFSFYLWIACSKWSGIGDNKKSGSRKIFCFI